MKELLNFEIVEYNIKSYIDTYLKLVNQKIRRILLSPLNQFALNFLKEASKHKPQIKFFAFESETELPSNVALMTPNTSIDATLLFIADAKQLSSELMKYIDLEYGIIIAPKTELYYKNMPLFLISIPKSGTHLLYNLVKSFGYIGGGNCPDNPQGGRWYCLDSMNSHTSTSFLEFNKSSWNLYHPFIKNPAIFIYRNPMDILTSEANYYHRDGKTAFWSYFDGLSFEERLLKLIDDPWLLGNIRDRMKDYIGWLDIKNVIPVSFEELVGYKGGGSEKIQTMLIWSLQLKLHIPGDPKYFGEKVFDKDSFTFHEGQMCSFKKYFTKKAYEKFYDLPQDFMNFLGYDFDYQKADNIIPKRSKEFRTRALIYSGAKFEKIPILFESNYLGHNIVKYNSLYYGIPMFLGEFRLERQLIFTLKLLASDDDLIELKEKIIARRKVPAFVWKVFWFVYKNFIFFFRRTSLSL